MIWLVLAAALYACFVAGHAAGYDKGRREW